MSSEPNSFANRFAGFIGSRLAARLALYGGGGLVIALLLYVYLTTTPPGEVLNVRYGERRGSGATSVNGTSVLADMFEIEGFKVRTVQRLSPRLRKEFDVIVWFPDDFEPPTPKQREFLEKWLADDQGRTLVYVGRDYVADPLYWKTAQGLTDKESATRMKSLESEARNNHNTQRAKMPNPKYARLFTVRAGGNRAPVKKLSGPWADGVDATKAQIEVQGILDVPKPADAAGAESGAIPGEMEVLLAGDGQPLAFRARDYKWNGQVIVVTNGSFLLNYPLVNPEHRKLAGKLIDDCGYPRSVAFLESKAGGPEVLDKDPPQSGGLTMFRVWPLNAIVIHLTIFGIVYCFARWPIFGRAKELPAENPADFGRHVTALGKLLQRSQNLAYAQSRLAQYHQQARRASGKSHLKG